MRYCQLSFEERHALDVLINLEKMSIRKIDKRLSRNPATIAREIKRNSINGYYSFDEANKLRTSRSHHKYSFKNLKYAQFTKEFIARYDKRCCGVQQTVELIKKEMPFVICPTARQVYNMMNSYT